MGKVTRLFSVFFSLYCPIYVKESKTVLESGFDAVDSGFQVLDASLCPDSNRWWDSGFLELYSRFQQQNVLGFLFMGRLAIVFHSALFTVSYLKKTKQNKTKQKELCAKRVVQFSFLFFCSSAMPTFRSLNSLTASV